jgi:HEAT repeat protein
VAAFQKWHDQSALWSVNQVEAILSAAELPANLLAQPLLNRETRQVWQTGNFFVGDPANAFSDWAAYLGRNPDAVRDALARADAENRLHVLQVLRGIQYDFTPVVDLLVQVGTGSAKTVRDEVLPLLHGQRERARPLIEAVLGEGDTAQRHEAVQLLWRLYGPDAAERLRLHAAEESSERVRQTIARLLSAPADDAGQDQELALHLPPLQLELGEVALPEAARVGIRAFVECLYADARANYSQEMEKWKSPNRPKWMQKPQQPPAFTEQVAEEVIRSVEGRVSQLARVDGQVQRWAWGKSLGDWLAPPDVLLIHVVRLDYALHFLQFQDGGRKEGLWWPMVQNLEAYRSRCQKTFGLREVDVAVASLPGAQPGMVAFNYLAGNNKYNSFCDWEPEAVWPVFAEHPDILRSLLKPSAGQGGRPARYDYSLPTRRQNAFRVLAMFPQLPPGYMPLLWDLALGESKTDRPLAQAALATVPDKAPKILVALDDGRQTVRAAAAEWLGQIGAPAAIGPLKDAFRKEKQEVVKGVIMAALETLGADVNEFLDRNQLLTEAAAGLKKKLPRGIEWLPFDQLPALHWDDSGEEVDRQVVRWWVVQSIQQKSPVCGPLLRRYLSLCRQPEAAALARFILSAWITQDTRPVSHEEASEKARQEADQTWAMYGQIKYYQDLYKGDKENLYRQLLQKHLNTCLGSAIDQKGMLALATAAGDADCVKMCEQYIRKWFGNRLAQCKALVEVLAWVKHPLAIQALLGFATRFRTKSIREAAEQHVHALAEREGWTIDELADRTIPDAGFERPTDAAGRPIGDQAHLVLDYGPRQFTVTLDDELQPVITTAEGKKIKSPPAPGKNDDPEKAAAAKKRFNEAKKVVKEVVRRQAERLYEALCTQRSWHLEDWKSYLADHPIVGKLCVRLSWAAFLSGSDQDSLSAESFQGCFRPLEDGSLTNERDEEVTLPSGAVVRLAHTCNIPADLGPAWLKHFADYDVEPLFQQFGRPTYTLPKERKNETHIKDFEGYMLTNFKLRSKAVKLGYVRGEAGDGGWFNEYRKPFPSLELQAVIEFTGSPLPEEDMPVALISLSFTRTQDERRQGYSWQGNQLPLSKVPAVLLSECYNDIQQIATEGTGFDPQWHKRSQY